MTNVIAFPNTKTLVYNSARNLSPDALHALAYAYDCLAAANVQLETGETVSLDGFMCDVCEALGAAGSAAAPVAERFGFTPDQIRAIQLGLDGQAPLSGKAA